MMRIFVCVDGGEGTCCFNGTEAMAKRALEKVSRSRRGQSFNISWRVAVSRVYERTSTAVWGNHAYQETTIPYQKQARK